MASMARTASMSCPTARRSSSPGTGSGRWPCAPASRPMSRSDRNLRPCSQPMAAGTRSDQSTPRPPKNARAPARSASAAVTSPPLSSTAAIPVATSRTPCTSPTAPPERSRRRPWASQESAWTVRTRSGRSTGRSPLRRGRVEVAQRREHLVVVGVGLDLLDDLAHHAVGVDDERRAAGAPVGLAVHGLLDPHAVGLGHRVVLIGQQLEVEVLLVGELLDGLD